MHKNRKINEDRQNKNWKLKTWNKHKQKKSKNVKNMKKEWKQMKQGKGNTIK